MERAIYKSKIVADSGSDTLVLKDIPFSSVPLKIITDKKEYVDNAYLDTEEMAKELYEYKGKSSSACPGIGDYLNAFEGAENVYCITITSGLSGSYNSAMVAKRDYEYNNPGRKVHVIDSLSTGPEMKLIIEKLREFINAGKIFETIVKEIEEYKKSTGLLFMLESMKNLANNGRVNPIVAKAVGLLGIRMVGKASDEGTLELLDKCRGEEKALKSIFGNMLKAGFKGGKVKIGHSLNENAALTLKDMIVKEFGSLVEIYKLRGLCSLYAEKGGLIIGFEKA
ncbi:MAG: DegV family EDD domain-containing protein [Ruminococcaceae bacterium]|nr:DegV family EDD domain-containing protein [Oscillospiraceae bacterium]